MNFSSFHSPYQPVSTISGNALPGSIIIIIIRLAFVIINEQLLFCFTGFFIMVRICEIIIKNVLNIVPL